MKQLLTLLGLFLFSHAFTQTPAWPHHKKAVIVLTYDDGLLSQLDNAVPQLKKAGFKATFFLTSDVDSSTIPRWRALAKKGFELGNHTLYHPCSPSEDVPVTSEHYTPIQVIREIEIMNRILFAIDGRNGRTYAYPCAETTVGGDKDYVDTLRRYNLVKYARIGGDTGAIITDFHHLDPLRIPSLGLEDSTSASALIDYVKSVQARNGMGIIMFHGISGDYITTDKAVHQQLLDYLKKNKKDIWVTTFREAMDYATHSSTPPPDSH
ncbi:MAG: polysaccharide deacetylase family protein [Bacteroidetes bacterium]|nr:polysaccharide deacetylase family protein [Bacteroidota bacterium]